MFRVVLNLVIIFFAVSVLVSAQPEKEDNESDEKRKIQLDPIIRKALLRALSELEGNETGTTDAATSDVDTNRNTDSEDKESNPVQVKGHIKYHSFVIDGQKVFNGNSSKVSSITGNELDFSATTKKTLSNDAYLNELIETNESSNIQQSRSILNSISSNSAKNANDKTYSSTKKPTVPTTTKTTTTTTPKPTHNDDGENIEEVSNKDVQVFQAPLVAAFTVHQDAEGLPKRVVPIVKSSPIATAAPFGLTSTSQIPIQNKQNDFIAQQINLQRQLEEKQRILEQQLILLQEQQRQQEEFLRRQQEELQKKQQQLQTPIAFKPLPESIVPGTSNDQGRVSQNFNQGSLVSIQQSRNIFPFEKKVNQNTFSSNHVQSPFNDAFPSQTGTNQIKFQRNQEVQQNQLLNSQQFQQLPVQRNQISSHENQLQTQQQFQSIHNQQPGQQNHLSTQQNLINFQRNENIQQLTPFQQLPIQNQISFSENRLQSPQNTLFQNSVQNQFQPNRPQFNQISPLQNGQGSVVSIQPSLSIESNSIVNQQLPSREAVDFLLHLRNQRPTQFPLQENHLPAGIGRLPLPSNVQNFVPAEAPRPVNQINANLNNGPQNLRVFRQESGTGNLGLNNNRINNNNHFGNQRFNNLQTVPKFTQPRTQGFRNSPDDELQQLLYQSGVGNAPREDLNIVSKVLALNHGIHNNNFNGNFNNNFNANPNNNFNGNFKNNFNGNPNNNFNGNPNSNFNGNPNSNFNGNRRPVRTF